MSKEDWLAVLTRLEGAYAPATLRSYRADIAVYAEWCVLRGYVPFPGVTATICAFLEDQGKSKAPSTVRRRVSAIRKVHRLLEWPDPTTAEEVNLTFRRVRRANPVRPKQAKGMTRPYLEAFMASEPETPIGLRNRAMLALGYELLARRSELVALREGDLERRDDGTLRVLIRRSKADPFGAGRLGFTSLATAKRVAAWQTWKGDEIAWLFCPIYQGKAINRGLEATAVKTLIKAAAARAGLDQQAIDAFSGHSMRVGAAQDLLRKGHSTSAIMRAGGWTNAGTLARYLEKAEVNVWS